MENRIWLKGDTHLHTCNSDGKLTPGQLVEACQQAGLDYAIITDHNYNTVKASYTDKNLLVMQGQEITETWVTSMFGAKRCPKIRRIS